MTPSEKFVSDLCDKSFLPFWSFLSPLGKKGKELCDVLVVCEKTIVIISVKEIKISEHQDENIQYERWQKKAVDNSVDQIYGAERFLKTVNEITLNDKKIEIQLPPLAEREIFRIAIAFGGENRFPLPTGDFGSGFVHVFDEESTFAVFQELDTIKDFIDYLKAKEKLLHAKMVFVPRELDFLALYLKTSLEFEFNADTIVIDEGMWEDYSGSDDYKKWRRTIRESFLWDEIITNLHRIHIAEKNDYRLITNLEKATRLITLEPRINRVELAMTLIDAIKKKVKARMVQPFSGSNHCYVFMPLSNKNWAQKEKELQLRCLIARCENKTATKIIGLAIGKDSDNEYMFDISYLDIPELTDELIKKASIIKQELGYFKKPLISHSKDLRKG